MNTKLFLGLVGGVIILAAVAYIWTSGGGEDVKSPSAESVEVNNGRFAELVKSGQSLECTFNHDDGENVSSGTVYLAAGGDRIRGDIDIEESAAGAMEVHLIRDDGYHYVWGSALPTGIKVEAPEPKEFFAAGGESPIDEENTEFDCKAWNVDESRFVPPANVDFQDMAAFEVDAEARMETIESIKMRQCMSCGMIADSAMQEQCRESLGCQ